MNVWWCTIILLIDGICKINILNVCAALLTPKITFWYHAGTCSKDSLFNKGISFLVRIYMTVGGYQNVLEITDTFNCDVALQ